jgi:hybrid cluster-associated redox disulfide protein
MRPEGFGAETTVDEIMERWPETVPVFIGLGMLCVGCTFGRYHSLAGACEFHGLALRPVARLLGEAITGR